MTSDALGYLYIGDFENKINHNAFPIYKVNSNDLNKAKATADIIEFDVPKAHEDKNFEGFFLWNDTFYLFNKEKRDFDVFKLLNLTGTHTATYMQSYEF